MTCCRKLQHSCEYEFTRFRIIFNCRLLGMSFIKILCCFLYKKEGPYKKGNFDNSFRIIKRIYKCKNTRDLRKIITMHCAARKSATGHSPVEEADKYALTFYKFKNEGRMIEPSKKSRIYLSVCEEFKRKIEQGKPQKKATHMD